MYKTIKTRIQRAFRADCRSPALLLGVVLSALLMFGCGDSGGGDGGTGAGGCGGTAETAASGGASGTPLTWINEEAVPRMGVKLQSTMQRARGPDGKTYVWLGRKTLTGRGEGSSGLRFDYLKEQG